MASNVSATALDEVMDEVGLYDFTELKVKLQRLINTAYAAGKAAGAAKERARLINWMRTSFHRYRWDEANANDIARMLEDGEDLP